MNDPGRREMEDLLRAALTDAAAQIHPAGDGLERVRERAAHRRRRLLWMRPVLVAATATVLVAAATTVPLYLRSAGSGDHSSALGSSPARTFTTLSTGTPPSPSAGNTAEPSPPGGSTTPKSTVPTRTEVGTPLPDMVTVWPYGSRHEGDRRADRDVADKVHPVLENPRLTALEFIRSFVGTDDPLVAEADEPLAAGIGVTVYRKSGTGDLQPVSLVYLVRVRRGDDSPYVVVDASRPPLAGGVDTMSVQPGVLAGVSPIIVTGTVTPQFSAEQVAQVKVELREPGQDRTLASQSPALSPDSDQARQKAWSVMLTPIRPLSTPTGTVAAWTVDTQNHLLSFVAAPTSAAAPTPHVPR